MGISAIHEAGGDQTADVMSATKATVASAAPLHIKFADWVLVHFAGKKTSGRGRQNGDDVTVKFVKKSG